MGWQRGPQKQRLGVFVYSWSLSYHGIKAWEICEIRLTGPCVGANNTPRRICCIWLGADFGLISSPSLTFSLRFSYFISLLIILIPLPMVPIDTFSPFTLFSLSLLLEDSILPSLGR